MRKLPAKGIAGARCQHHEIGFVTRRTRTEAPVSRSSADVYNALLRHLRTGIAGSFEHQPVQCKTRENRDLTIQWKSNFTPGRSRNLAMLDPVPVGQRISQKRPACN